METSLDGGSVFQNVINNTTGKSFSIFSLLEDIVSSIRTASSGVNAIKSIGQAEITVVNKNPGTWSFDVQGTTGSQTISVEIIGDNPTEIVDKVNLYIKVLSLLINIVCYDIHNVLSVFIF